MSLSKEEENLIRGIEGVDSEMFEALLELLREGRIQYRIEHVPDEASGAVRLQVRYFVKRPNESEAEE